MNIPQTFSALKIFLDEKSAFYNQPHFIETDPIQIPRKFQNRQDLEIAAFLSATIAWGNRKSIIKSAEKMMALMDHTPSDFVRHHSDSDLQRLKKFVHRTFNGEDFIFFVKQLQRLYAEYSSMEDLFLQAAEASSLQKSIHHFKNYFFEGNFNTRTAKHISDPAKGSAAKRINMFLRWMVRKDHHGVDLGIWKELNPAQLSCPLDVHSGNVARKLGLLHRQQNDAKAVTELDHNLRKLDPKDPVKYDFALFGVGVFEKF